MTKPPVSGSRAPRWMLDSRPRAPAAAPLDREHDQVEGVHGLDLDPGRAAATGVVGRGQVLDHHALVAGGERVGEERRGLAPRRGDQPGHPVRARGPGRPAPRSRSAAGASSRSLAVEVQQVEEVRRDERRPSGLARCATRCPGTGAGGRSSSSAIASPSSTTRSAGSARTTATTSGSRSVMSSRLRVATVTSSPSRCTWIRMPSSLTSTATVGARRPWPCAATTSGALEASIGSTGRPTSSPNRPAPPPRPSNAARDDRRRCRRRASPPDAPTASGTPAADATRLLDEGVERALADRRRSRRPRSQVCSSAVARPNRSATAAARSDLRPRPGQGCEPLEGLVHLGRRSGWVTRPAAASLQGHASPARCAAGSSEPPR